MALAGKILHFVIPNLRRRDNSALSSPCGGGSITFSAALTGLSVRAIPTSSPAAGIRCRVPSGKPGDGGYSRFSSSGSGTNCTQIFEMAHVAVCGPAAVGVFLNVVARINPLQPRLAGYRRWFPVTSLDVTIPSTEPKFIHHKAKWVPALRNCSSADSSGSASGRPAAGGPVRAGPAAHRAKLLLQQVDDVHHAEKILFIIAAGHHRAGGWFLSSSARIAFRRAQVDVLNIVAGGHNMLLTVRWLRFQHALIIRRSCGSKICPIALVGKHRRGTTASSSASSFGRSAGASPPRWCGFVMMVNGGKNGDG